MSTFPDDIRFHTLLPGLYKSTSGFYLQVLPGGELHILYSHPSWGFITISHSVNAVWVDDDILNEYVLPYSNRGPLGLGVTVSQGSHRNPLGQAVSTSPLNLPSGIASLRVACLAQSGRATFGRGPTAEVPAVLAGARLPAGPGPAAVQDGAQTDVNPGQSAACSSTQVQEAPDIGVVQRHQVEEQPVHDDAALDALSSPTPPTAASSSASHTADQIRAQVTKLEEELKALSWQLGQVDPQESDSPQVQAQNGGRAVITGASQGHTGQNPAIAPLSPGQGSDPFVGGSAAADPQQSARYEPAKTPASKPGQDSPRQAVTNDSSGPKGLKMNMSTVETPTHPPTKEPVPGPASALASSPSQAAQASSPASKATPNVSGPRGRKHPGTAAALSSSPATPSRQTSTGGLAQSRSRGELSASSTPQSSSKGYIMPASLAASNGSGWAPNDPLAHEIISGARVAFHHEHPGIGPHGAPELKMLADKLSDRKKPTGEKWKWTLAEYEFLVLNFYLWDEHKRGNISLQMSKHYIVRHDKDTIDQMKGKLTELLIKYSKLKAAAAILAANNSAGETHAEGSDKGKSVEK